MPQSPEAEPSFLPTPQKPSPKAELEHSSQGTSPAPGLPGPHSPRVPGVPPPSRRGCRYPRSGPPGHSRALPCSAGPAGAGRAQGAARAAMASSRALPASQGPVLLPGQAAGGGGGSGSSPRPRGGRGCGEGSEKARPRFLEGRALLTGGAGALSRLLPAAPSPRLARPGTPGFQRLGRPNVRDRNARVRTFEAGFQGSDRSRLGLLRSERRWFAPSPGWLRRSRRHLRVPSTVRSGPPTREPWGRLRQGLWGPRAPPAASTPRADRLSAAPSGMHYRAWF